MRTSSPRAADPRAADSAYGVHLPNPFHDGGLSFAGERHLKQLCCARRGTQNLSELLRAHGGAKALRPLRRTKCRHLAGHAQPRASFFPRDSRGAASTTIFSAICFVPSYKFSVLSFKFKPKAGAEVVRPLKTSQPHTLLNKQLADRRLFMRSSEFLAPANPPAQNLDLCPSRPAASDNGTESVATTL